MRAIRFFTALGFLTTPLPPVLIRAVFFWPGLSFFAVFFGSSAASSSVGPCPGFSHGLSCDHKIIMMAMSRQQALCTCSERATGLTTEYCEGT